jgi:hypothetical protein
MEQLHAPTALPVGDGIGPDTLWIGGWAGPKVSLDAVGKRKTLPLEGFEPRPSTELLGFWAFSSSGILENTKFRILDLFKSSNPVILCVIHHHQNHLVSIRPSIS